MKTVSFAIQKGGTGKTTSVVMISALLAKKDHRVLLVDMDPQASATECLINPALVNACIGDVLLSKVPITNAIRNSGCIRNLDFIPSKPDILIEEYFGHYSSIFPDMLKIKLDGLRDAATQQDQYKYDYVIIDCPPNLLHFTKNALWASDYVVNTLEPEPLAYEGLNQFIISILPDVQLRNPNLRPAGAILINRAPATRVYLPEEIRRRINSNGAMGPAFMFRSEIHLDQELAKMPLHRKPACEYASSRGVTDFAAVVVEFENRIPP